MDSEPNHNPSLTFSVTSEQAGERLDAFLARKIEGWSRGRLQQLIEDGEVLVNGRASKSSYKLRAQDEVDVELAHPASSSLTPENIPIDIVYEDDDLVVVNKPAGMVTHPGSGVESGTLANALAFHFQQLSTLGGAARPGIVHRLDKGTSGLLVVAKTENAHQTLADQFRAREVRKSYLALAHGQVKTARGQIDQPIARDPRHRTRMAVMRGGRSALSLYKVRRHFERFTLLDVEPRTGRTHQIRVHLAWLKHPVVGDDVYGGGRDKTVPDAKVRSRIAKLGRQFLHAEQLSFGHPRTKEQLNFTAPLTLELQQLLDEIQASDHKPAAKSR